MGAHIFPKPFRPEPGQPFHLINGRNVDDIHELSRMERRRWGQMSHELLMSGDPLLINSPYGGVLGTPLAVAGTAVNPAVATETGLWNVPYYTPLPVGMLVPTAYRMYACGIFTTTATASPTLILTPRIGTTTSGITLGASRAIPLTASVTTGYWIVEAHFTSRTVGDSTTAATMYGMLNFMATNAAGPQAAAVNELFGHTAAAFDGKVAQGLFLAMTSNPAGATTSMTVQQIHWISFN